MKAFFKYAEYVAPRYAGKVANDLWFTAPPRMNDLPVPSGGRGFTVRSEGADVVGHVWGEAPIGVSTSSTDGAPKTVYLVHGWGGRGSQFGAMVEPLVAAGYRVVMFDAPSHGDSGVVAKTGPRLTHGIEFSRALDAVFDEFGPAEAVIAHSLGTIATYLELRYGWLGTERLVFVAPMVDAISLFDGFQAALGFGKRTRRAMEQACLEFTGLPVKEFDARKQSTYLDSPLPTLVVHDLDDRQTPYSDAEAFAHNIGADLLTTEGLGHRRVLRDPAVIARVVAFVSQGPSASVGARSVSDRDLVEVAG